MAACLLLAQCASYNPYGVPASSRVVSEGDEIPRGGGTYRVGRPYTIAGRTYVPRHEPNYRAEGIASWYGRDFHGRLTANGEVYDMNAISAAHPTLPIPSYARVTNLANGRSIVVRVNDRGPFVANRVIDLSVKTAKLLGTHAGGLQRVRVEYVGRAPLEGSDDRMLVATLRHGSPAPAPSAVMVAQKRKGVPVEAEDDDEATPTVIAARNRPSPWVARPGRAAARDVELSSAERLPAPPAAEADPAPAPAAPRSANPLASFFPAWDTGALGLMTGRGLY